MRCIDVANYGFWRGANAVPTAPSPECEGTAAGCGHHPRGEHCHTANGSFRCGHMPQNTHENCGHSTKKTLLTASSLYLGKFVAVCTN
jgi:hypothetical protein